jgi:hypothetical protein
MHKRDEVKYTWILDFTRKVLGAWSNHHAKKTPPAFGDATDSCRRIGAVAAGDGGHRHGCELCCCKPATEEDGVEEFCAFHATRAFSMGSQAPPAMGYFKPYFFHGPFTCMYTSIPWDPDTHPASVTCRAVPAVLSHWRRRGLCVFRSLVREGISAAERSGGGEGGFAQQSPYYFLICLWVSSSIRYDEMV